VSEPREHDDGLFSPSLSDRVDAPSGKRPWRLGSQFYVAFFGGPLAAAAIGVLNGRRLGIADGRLLAIAAAGVAALAVAVAAAAAFDSEDARPRFFLVVAGVATYFVARQLQKAADDRHRRGRPDEQVYDSLWGPGLAAVVVCGILSVVALSTVIA
jgi:uncharacterized membrane protein YfcA